LEVEEARDQCPLATTPMFRNALHVLQLVALSSSAAISICCCSLRQIHDTRAWTMWCLCLIFVHSAGRLQRSAQIVAAGCRQYSISWCDPSTESDAAHRSIFHQFARFCASAVQSALRHRRQKSVYCRCS